MNTFLLEYFPRIINILPLLGGVFLLISVSFLIIIIYKSFSKHKIYPIFFMLFFGLSFGTMFLWGNLAKYSIRENPSLLENLPGTDTATAFGDKKGEKNTSREKELQHWFQESIEPEYVNKDEQKNIFEKISPQKINEAYSLLEKYYVNPEKITPKKMEEWIIRGLVYSVDDDYSEYFNDEQSEDFKKHMEGNFEGIGAALEKIKGNVTITEILKNTPAADSGLLPGDIIVSVDTKKIEDESLYDTVAKIRGEKGTVVNLEIFREGKSDLVPVPVTRDTIHVESVTLEWKGKNSDIAVFEISQFGDEMIEEFKKLFAKVDEKKSSKKLKGIIIDLRYNGGGYLVGAVDLASYFLPASKKIVTITDKSGEKEEYFSSPKYVNDIKTPLVILINGGSASASEIFTGSLQDYTRATIIGDDSFGKGSVQQIFPLGKNSDEQIKITIAKWTTPEGKSPTHDDPISPDIKVEFDRTKMTDEQRENKYDPQLEQAIEFFE